MNKNIKRKINIMRVKASTKIARIRRSVSGGKNAS